MSRIYACAYLSIIVLMLPAPSKAQILRCPAAPAAPASQLLFAILGVQLKADAAAAARIWTRVVLKGQLGVKRGLTPLTSGALLSRAGRSRSFGSEQFGLLAYLICAFKHFKQAVSTHHSTILLFHTGPPPAPPNFNPFSKWQWQVQATLPHWKFSLE